MLARLFGKKCDHPMADVKSAQALLDDLPKHDMLKSATELTDWIESVANHEEFRLADQFAVLSLLDETAQFYARKLACEYFTLPDLNTFQGNRLCLVLGNLSCQTANAYYGIFSRYCNGDKTASVIKSQLPLLVVRAVRLMRGQLKYAAVHYDYHDDTIWRRLAQLYLHAEQQQYLDVPLNLYSALSEPTSMKCESGQLLAWYACGINCLAPRSMHLTERIIAQYGSSIEISANLTTQALFGFDLAHPNHPVRVNVDATLHPLMRYISLTGMQASLGALIKTLEKNMVPQELNLGGVFAAERVLEAAQHVWTCLVAPPIRLSKRRELNALLNVVVGFENVYWRCKYLDQESSEYPSAQWTLENASVSSFYAVLPGQGTGGVRIGDVLSMQTAGVPRLGVAIARHLLRDVEGRLHVGAEILANQVSEVVLCQSGVGGCESSQSALWLHAAVEDGTVRLLMPANTFSMLRSLKTCFEGKHYLLIPIELQGSGVDYDLASFRVIEQEEAEG